MKRLEVPQVEVDPSLYSTLESKYEKIVKEYENTKSAYLLGGSRMYVYSGKITYDHTFTLLEELKKALKGIKKPIKTKDSYEYKISLMDLCNNIEGVLFKSLSPHQIILNLINRENEEGSEIKETEYKDLIANFIQLKKEIHKLSTDFRTNNKSSESLQAMERTYSQINEKLNNLCKTIASICDFLKRREDEYHQAQQCLEYINLVNTLNTTLAIIPSTADFGATGLSSEVVASDLSDIRGVSENFKRIAQNLNLRYVRHTQEGHVEPQ